MSIYPMHRSTYKIRFKIYMYGNILICDRLLTKNSIEIQGDKVGRKYL